MSRPIERYYERELALLSNRQDALARYFARLYPAEAGCASTFAQRYPAKAGELEFGVRHSVDPHAERFIQGFAFLAGRIHHKIDSEFPQLTEALLGIFHPHLLLPVPAMTVAQFVASPAAGARRLDVPKGSRLISRPVGHPPTPCQWRTGYAVELWPLDVTEASLRQAAYFGGLPLPRDTAAVLKLGLQCRSGLRFAALPLDKLRFYLHGDREAVATLYELLFNNTTAVLLRDPSGKAAPAMLTLPAERCLSPVGLGLDEGLLPFPAESFAGYRLLTEFFTFPNKFWFADVGGLSEACAAGFGDRLEVYCCLNRFDAEVARAVDVPMFQLGCTPVINVFPKTAEPIALTHTQHEYKVVPGRGYARDGIEIYSVDQVSTFDPERGEVKDYLPFYALAFGESTATRKAFWYAKRRSSPHGGARCQDVYLVLVDGDFDPHLPAEESVNVHTTCTNGEIASQFLRAGDTLTFAHEPRGFRGAVRLLQAPTPPRRPALGQQTFGRWLSQTLLAHAPLSDADEGIDALKETLLLCASAALAAAQPHEEAVTRQLIDGVAGFTARRVVRGVHDGGRIGAVQGVEFTLELDRAKYVGTGAFLFASVLERFLGLYAAVNSFSQLLVRTTQGKGYLKKWPPRASEQILS